jgi:deoxyribodipyrimidine photo-lyase
MKHTLVWFRQDLRLKDNPALYFAASNADALLFVYILDDETPDTWRMGAASRWWLHHSLTSLASTLEEKGHQLVLKRGNAESVLKELVVEENIDEVVFNRCYEPYNQQLEKGLHDSLGAEVKHFNGSLLFDLDSVKTQGGGYYKVYTAFWKSCLKNGVVKEALAVPDLKSVKSISAESDGLNDWRLLPTKPDWAKGLKAEWTPGEEGARKAAEAFLEEGVAHYGNGRDVPSQKYTSKLSPHLHFGEVSPRQIWQATHMHQGESKTKNHEKFLAEVGWREFAHYLLHHFPTFPEKNFNAKFDPFPWLKNPEGLKAWQRGETGYPIVDAGMRQLWQTGWMHNRVRMIVASFLTKHLLIHWEEGEKWFWDTLVDADLANNAAGWQWVAGTGADASPYFRVFNPILQGEKFDKEGEYVREWVPEIAGLPNSIIHKPWEADTDMLKQAGVELGKDYPNPIIEHKRGRERALEAYQSIRGNK